VFVCSFVFLCVLDLLTLFMFSCRVFFLALLVTFTCLHILYIDIGVAHSHSHLLTACATIFLPSFPCLRYASSQAVQKERDTWYEVLVKACEISSSGSAAGGRMVAD
jgi:hypothetical protein